MKRIELVRRYSNCLIFVLSIFILLGCIFLAKMLMKEVDSVYYITESGQKFHQAGCQYLKGNKHIIEISVDEINKFHYEPYKVCIE